MQLAKLIVAEAFDSTNGLLRLPSSIWTMSKGLIFFVGADAGNIAILTNNEGYSVAIAIVSRVVVSKEDHGFVGGQVNSVVDSQVAAQLPVVRQVYFYLEVSIAADESLETLNFGLGLLFGFSSYLLCSCLFRDIHYLG